MIVYSPMQAGILTDSFSADRVKQMAPEDWRRKSSISRRPGSKNLALRNSLKPIAKRHETTVAAVALAWTLLACGDGRDRRQQIAIAGRRLDRCGDAHSESDDLDEIAASKSWESGRGRRDLLRRREAGQRPAVESRWERGDANFRM